MSSAGRAGFVFAAGLIAIAVLRLVATRESADGLSTLATVAYVAWTVVFAVRLRRLGVESDRLGFGVPVHWLRVIALATLGVVVIKTYSIFLAPSLAEWIGSARDLSRFEPSFTSLSAALRLIAFSWLFAAVGEELAFRVVLLRLLRAGLPDGRWRSRLAVVGQAVVFALVHMVQGPAGMLDTFFSGLVYGGIVVAARGSIWPSLLAHGLNNTISILLLYRAAGA